MTFEFALWEAFLVFAVGLVAGVVLLALWCGDCDG
jgi:hypothetical protein